MKAKGKGEAHVTESLKDGPSSLTRGPLPPHTRGSIYSLPLECGLDLQLPQFPSIIVLTLQPQQLS